MFGEGLRLVVPEFERLAGGAVDLMVGATRWVVAFGETSLVEVTPLCIVGDFVAVIEVGVVFGLAELDLAARGEFVGFSAVP